MRIQGRLAQMVERSLSMWEVPGSIPGLSNFLTNKPWIFLSLWVAIRSIPTQPPLNTALAHKPILIFKIVLLKYILCNYFSFRYNFWSRNFHELAVGWTWSLHRSIYFYGPSNCRIIDISDLFKQRERAVPGAGDQVEQLRPSEVARHGHRLVVVYDVLVE